MCNKLKFLCKGGPFDGAYIWLATGTTGTLVFSLNGQRGHYEREVVTYPLETSRKVHWKEAQE